MSRDFERQVTELPIGVAIPTASQPLERQNLSAPDESFHGNGQPDLRLFCDIARRRGRNMAREVKASSAQLELIRYLWAPISRRS